MPIKKGQRLGGVYSLDDLKTRIEIDEFTDCWHFLNTRGQRFTGPKTHIWYGPTQKAMSAVSGAWLIANPGKSIPEGQIAYRTCSCFDCVNPAHIRIGDRKQFGKNLKANGSQRTIAKINTAINNARKRAKVTEEMKLAIVQSSKTNKELGEEFGLNPRYVWAIRTRWAAKNSPFAQLYNFAMKAAA